MMRTTLHHDAETGQLRLAFTDLWAGEHELTEYRVIRPDGTPVRNRPDLDGKTAYRGANPDGPEWYVRRGDDHDRFDTDQAPVTDVKVPCRAAG